MLIEFKVSNYRSFRDEVNLSMKAQGLKEFESCLLNHNNLKIVPSVAVYGKNGSGKSNIIRAFWLSVQFIKNAQRTQHENASIPLTQFALNDYSENEPTTFAFTYVVDGIKYMYEYTATERKILSESLSYAPKGKSVVVFKRQEQNFDFPVNSEKRIKELMSNAVRENQLFFSIACTMNYEPCIMAMKWFREKVSFSKDFTDVPRQLLENSHDNNMLDSMVKYANEADIGIEKMEFEFKNTVIGTTNGELPEDATEEQKIALENMIRDLGGATNIGEGYFSSHEITAKSYHSGVTKAGVKSMWALELGEESDGTRKLMAISPAICRVLSEGGVFVMDEIEKELHPKLVEFIVSKFQSKETNKAGAQLIFTTHNTELLNMEYIRKDQVYFVDKDRETGVSELYGLTEFSLPTHTNVRKSYLLGKFGATPNVDIEEIF